MLGVERRGLGEMCLAGKIIILFCFFMLMFSFQTDIVDHCWCVTLPMKALIQLLQMESVNPHCLLLGWLLSLLCFYCFVVVAVVASALGEGRPSAGALWMTFDAGSSVFAMTPI